MTISTFEAVQANPCNATKLHAGPSVLTGDPNIETTKQAILALDEVGADVIELGVPYSDPLADGPTIQAAHTRGLLQAHVSLDDVLELVSACIILYSWQAGSPHLMCPFMLHCGPL